MPCPITINDLKDYKSCQQLNFCCSDDVLQYKLDLAISIIESITNTKICPYIDCKTFVSADNRNKTLFFTPVTSNKLISITSVKHIKCDCEVDLTDYINDSHSLKFDCGKCFPCGKIQICGTWADYSDIPAYIREAVYLLTFEKVSPGITGLTSSQGLVEKVEWDDFKITYTDAQKGIIDSTGYYEIDRLISMVPTHTQIKFSIVDGVSSKSCCNNDKCSGC